MKEKEKVKKDEYQKALIAYNQAMKIFHKGEFAKAAESLTAFLEKHSSEKEIVDRAQIYLKLCNARQKKARIQLNTFDDYYQYSVYKINQGEYKEALKLLEKAREMKPREGKIMYLMANAYLLMGHKDECLSYLRKAIQYDRYFRILAQNERDFQSLWEDKKFKLITRMT
jgi:tetratricopeptide (TPR) repeat protein